MYRLFTQLSTLNHQLAASQQLVIRVRAAPPLAVARLSRLGLVGIGLAGFLRWTCIWLFFQTSQFKLQASLPALVPIANQTGFHATTAVKARRPCSRTCTSLPNQQTSNVKGVLQRATAIHDYQHAAAMVDVS